MLRINSHISKFFKRKISFGYGLICILTIILFVYFLTSGSRGNSFSEENGRCDTCGIGITDLVRQVKKELLALEDSMVKHNEDAVFHLKDFEMEINFVVRENTSAKLQGNYEVIAVEGSKEYSNEKVQKIRLHWEIRKTPPSPEEVSPTPLDPKFLDSLKNIPK